MMITNLDTSAMARISPASMPLTITLANLSRIATFYGGIQNWAPALHHQPGIVYPPH